MKCRFHSIVPRVRSHADSLPANEPGAGGRPPKLSVPVFGLAIDFFAGARAAPTSYRPRKPPPRAKLYHAQCSACHGARLQRVTAPALRGGPTMATRTGPELYKFMSTQMPLTKPGSLTPAQYAAVMAFLLKANGHRAGTTALTPASARTIATPI